jgi:hypothetical protein
MQWNEEAKTIPLRIVFCCGRSLRLRRRPEESGYSGLQ